MEGKLSEVETPKKEVESLRSRVKEKDEIISAQKAKNSKLVEDAEMLRAQLESSQQAMVALQTDFETQRREFENQRQGFETQKKEFEDQLLAANEAKSKAVVEANRRAIELERYKSRTDGDIVLSWLDIPHNRTKLVDDWLKSPSGLEFMKSAVPEWLNEEAGQNFIQDRYRDCFYIGMKAGIH